jgi:hypothetical protein
LVISTDSYYDAQIHKNKKINKKKREEEEPETDRLILTRLPRICNIIIN